MNNKGRAGFSISDSENQVAQARLAFHEGVQAATEAGTRSLAAARRLAMPVLWGAVFVGGAVAVFAVARLVRQRRRENAFLRIVVEPARSERSLARTAGAAIARLALERLLSSVSDAARANTLRSSVSGELPGTLGSDHRRWLDSSSVQRNSTTYGRQETIG